MSKSVAITRYRPERPIYLNEQNTDSKNKTIALYNVEQLRSLGWLCCYSEQVRPLHLSFNDEREFQEFKRDCATLKIKLKSPVIVPDEPFIDTPIIAPEPTESYEDPLGKLHIE